MTGGAASAHDVPVGRSLQSETQIRLVDERCRLQRMTASFLAQIVMRQSAQLGVDEGEEGVLDVTAGHGCSMLPALQ